MTTYQYMLVQCPKCGTWFVCRGVAGKRSAVSLDDLVKCEQLLFNECEYTKHKGRRRWRSAEVKRPE